MTTGALIFAHNNSLIDYTKLAVFCAQRIKRFLGIPVTIATDNIDYLLENFPDHPFDTIVEVKSEVSGTRMFYDGSLYGKNTFWNNVTRYRTYDISPYDRTLLIDSDYIINSDFLKTILERDAEFQIFKDSFDICSWRDMTWTQRINSYSIPFYWATVVIFDKTEINRSFFDLISYIKQNWQYFKVLYSIDYGSFRNDFAFSIAIHIMNGKTNGGFATNIPRPISFISDRDFLLDIKEDSMKFLVEKADYLGEYTLASVGNIDVHAMNKHSLLRFIDGGYGV